MPTAPLRLSLAQARAAWIQVQALDRPIGGLLPTLERTGFVRTLGGVEAYLALQARVPGLRARDVDAALAAGQAQVTPAVRGCMYLVARRDVPAALRFAESIAQPRAEKEHEKAGIKKGEVHKVAAAALAVLAARGPLATDALRKALPAGTVRSLGEAGKKIGISSPLPSALRALEFAGVVERVLEGGRLDSERYLWRAAARSPFAGAKLPADRVALLARLAEVFLRAAGVGSVGELAAWAGVSQRDAKAAVELLDVVPVAIAGVAEPRVALAELSGRLGDVDAARAAVALLPFEDNLVALQGGPALLVEPAYHGIAVPSWGAAGESTLGEARHMANRAVIAEGKLVGLWEYDPDARAVVYACFDPVAPATRAALDGRAAEVGELLAGELGHGRSFSLDTDDELRKRSAYVRTLAAPVGRSKRRSGRA